MKFTALLAVLIALRASALSLGSPAISAFLQRDILQANGNLVELGTQNVHGINVQRVKVRYGPYHIPGAEVLEPQTLQTMYQGRGKGTLTNIPSMDIKKPCDECLVTRMQASLEDEAGKDVNIAEGVMLHHMVLMSKLCLSIFGG
jgi:hypothetical protein